MITTTLVLAIIRRLVLQRVLLLTLGIGVHVQSTSYSIIVLQYFYSTVSNDTTRSVNIYSIIQYFNSIIVPVVLLCYRHFESIFLL